MARFVLALCPECIKKEMAEIIEDTGSLQTLACGGCKERYQRTPPPVFQRSLRYPMLNASLGTVVTSREHENSVAKKMGMVPVMNQTIAGRRPKVTRKKLFKAAKV